MHFANSRRADAPKLLGLMWRHESAVMTEKPLLNDRTNSKRKAAPLGAAVMGQGALGNSPSRLPVDPRAVRVVIAPIVAPAVRPYLIPVEFMETFSTTRTDEQADWGARVEDSCMMLHGKPSVLAPKPTKSAVLRLVGEDQPSQPRLGKWAVVSLCAILSSTLVYFIFLRT